MYIKYLMQYKIFELPNQLRRSQTHTHTHTCMHALMHSHAQKIYILL